MQHALWPTLEDFRKDVKFASALTQDFVDLFKGVRAAHMHRMGVDDGEIRWLDATPAA